MTTGDILPAIPFLFSILLALISPVINNFWKKEMRSDAKELENEKLISSDITDEFINITQKAVGTVQMTTALLITAVSGFVQIIQSIPDNLAAISLNIGLFIISIYLLYHLFSHDPHLYSFFRGIPITRSAIYTITVNLLFLTVILYL
jgi:hypothetical protein